MQDDTGKATKDDTKKSRTFELKQRLLRRAWDGSSSLADNGAEMMQLIQDRLSKVSNMPEDHKKMLDESKLLNMDQPRSVQMLNTLAMHNDEVIRFSDDTGMKPVH